MRRRPGTLRYAGRHCGYVAAVTESQREVVPRADDGELDTALAFLRFARRCLLKKLDGLAEDQARRPMVASGTSLAGLVRHAIDGEQYWFGTHLIGVGTEPDWDAHMTPDPDEPIVALVERYRAAAAAAAADAAIEQLGDAKALSVGLVDGRRKTLRWTLAHVTAETARHAGHADILRELIDGSTGR